MIGLKAEASIFLRAKGIHKVFSEREHREIKLGNAKTIDVVKRAIAEGF